MVTFFLFFFFSGFGCWVLPNPMLGIQFYKASIPSTGPSPEAQKHLVIREQSTAFYTQYLT